MHPNAEDGLVPDITEQFKRHYYVFKTTAEQHTLKFAKSNREVQAIDNGGIVDSTDIERIIAVEGCSTSHSIQSKVDPTEGTLGSGSLVNNDNKCTIKNSDIYEYVADGYTIIGSTSPSVLDLLNANIDSIESYPQSNKRQKC